MVAATPRWALRGESFQRGSPRGADGCDGRTLNPVRPSRGERAAGAGILLALVLLAAGIFLSHARIRYNPAPTGEFAAGGLSAMPAHFAPPGCSMSAPEVFTPGTLYDKIDGKAELYVPAGVRFLFCQRFEPAGGGDPWFELFAYRMADARSAFAVFSLQRRSGAPPSPVTDLAYRGGNALFLAHGPWYLELIGSVEGEKTEAALEAAARAFVDAHPADDAQLKGTRPLPRRRTHARLLPAPPLRRLRLRAVRPRVHP